MAKKKKSGYITRHRKKVAFLTAFAEAGTVTRAAEIAEITRTQHYDWLKTDPIYAEDFERAKDQSIDRLEQEARRRAIEGLRKKKFTSKGQPVIDPETGEQYWEHEYSDTLLIFLLKGNAPEKYGDKVKQELSGPGGNPLKVVFNIPRPDQGQDYDQDFSQNPGQDRDQGDDNP